MYLFTKENGQSYGTTMILVARCKSQRGQLPGTERNMNGLGRSKVFRTGVQYIYHVKTKLPGSVISGT